MTRTISTSSLRLPDRICPGVRLLFVGINPSVQSAELGHHFAGRGNRFWRLLFDARLVPEQLRFEDDVRLPNWGLGLTNLVARPTPSVATLDAAELAAGVARLRRKMIGRLSPAGVVLVGVTVFRALFPARKGPVALGIPVATIAGSTVFVVPNPSGRNAHYRYEEMRTAYARLGESVWLPTRWTSSFSEHERLRDEMLREGEDRGRPRGLLRVSERGLSQAVSIVSG
jgi:TDG/mug DNA glycosylase family protein